jgi:hypothetical protein
VCPILYFTDVNLLFHFLPHSTQNLRECQPPLHLLILCFRWFIFSTFILNITLVSHSFVCNSSSEVRSSAWICEGFKSLPIHSSRRCSFRYSQSITRHAETLCVVTNWRQSVSLWSPTSLCRDCSCWFTRAVI